MLISSFFRFDHRIVTLEFYRTWHITVLPVLYIRFVSSSISDLQSTETFRSSGGPLILIGFLNGGSENLDILNSGFAVVSAAATGNEVLKELFMELKIDELILQTLHKENSGSIQSLYDAIRVLLTPDDTRVVASQVSIRFLSLSEDVLLNLFLLCFGFTMVCFLLFFPQQKITVMCANFRFMAMQENLPGLELQEFWWVHCRLG